MRRSSVRSASSRRGFTLVELLVAMGLTLFIMVILVEAFTTGLATFSGLRAMGALQNQVRSATQLMRNDLQQSHFEGSRCISDSNFAGQPPREGFFVIRQGSAAASSNPMYQSEGVDLDGNNFSYVARDHVLHFANRLRGNRRENFIFDGTAVAGFVNYRTSLLGLLLDATYGVDLVAATSTTYSSQWSEVAYVMSQATSPQPSTIPDSGVALHNLYRINLLVVPYTRTINNLTPITYDAMKFQLTSQKNNGGKFQFFSPNDLAKGNRSFNPAGSTDPSATNPNMRGKSLVCTNVVSFQVRILKDGSNNYEDVPTGTFDTAVGAGYRVLGIQIILRVFDPGSGLTRQVTIVQDL